MRNQQEQSNDQSQLKYSVKTVMGIVTDLIASALVEKSATVVKPSHTESIYGALDLVDLKELTAHTFNKCTLELSYGSLSILRNSKKMGHFLQ